MWTELLPKMIGGTLIDDDAPHHPTVIVGYELTDTFVTIKGEAFDFGGARDHFGIQGGRRPGQFRLCGVLLSATVIMPERSPSDADAPTA